MMVVMAEFDALVLGDGSGPQEKQDTLASVGLLNTVDMFLACFSSAESRHAFSSFQPR
jgi:hypothetical protein